VEIEIKLGRHLKSAYELPTVVARADTTSFSVNHTPGESVEENLLSCWAGTTIKPLSELQKQILCLMKMPSSLYQVDSVGNST
jgi:hypothetical protein